MNIRTTIRSLRFEESCVEIGDSVSDVSVGRGKSDLWNPNNFHGFGTTHESSDSQFIRTYRHGSTIKSSFSGMTQSSREGPTASPMGESIQSEVVMMD